MPQEREAESNFAAFHKFTDVGQAVAGLVTRGGTTENGDFVILAPVIVRDRRESSWYRGQEMAIGFTTDLSMKLSTRADVGRYVLIEFTDTEQTNKGNKKKLFRVMELSRDEIIGLRDGTFTLAEALPAQRSIAGDGASDDF